MSSYNWRGRRIREDEMKEGSQSDVRRATDQGGSYPLKTGEDKEMNSPARNF